MRLDVTSVFNDPNFHDTIDIIRSHNTVDNYGRVVTTTTTYSNVVAVVTQKNGHILRREAAGERIEGKIAVYTQFLLTDGRDQNQDFTADIVVYPAGNGNKYTVTLLNDYNRWGAGWTSAVCDLLPVTPNEQPFTP